MAATFADSALLLVDLQVGWSRSDYVARNYPDFKRNVQDLVQFARKHNMLIVHIYADYNKDNTLWHDKGYFPIERNVPDLDIVKPLPNEKIFYKPTYDAFYATTLGDYLRSKGIKNVFGAGLVTGVCVLNTMHGAYIRGFTTFIVRDCCADHPKPLHELIIERYSRNHTWRAVNIRDGLKISKL